VSDDDRYFHQALSSDWRDPNTDPSYRALFETIQHGLVVISPLGAIRYANRAMARLLGEYAQALHGRQLEDFFHPDERTDALDARAKRREGISSPHRFPRRFLRADGSVVDTVGFATPLFAGGELVGFLTEYSDVTDELRRERMLAATLNEEAAILETATTPIVLIDEHGTIHRVNAATARVFGWLEEELVGQNVGLLASARDAKYHTGYIQHFLETGEASTPEGLVFARTREVRARRRDGSEFPADLTVGMVPSNDSGPRRFVGVLHDISDRQHAEQQLLVAQKTESLARLIAGVAHDFNNLLTVMGGSIELAQGHSAEADKWLDSAQSAVGRASSIVRQLLQYARQQPRQGPPLDVVALISSTVSLVEQMMDRRISMRLDVAEEMPQVAVDRSQMEQVVMNLLVNACDAIGDLLELGKRESGFVEVHVVRDRLAGQPAVRFTVTDNGPGIPPDVIERVFDPFFTTKPEGRGTGLGLSTSYGIVRSHRGEIAAESMLGEGAMFTISLPGSTVTSGLGQDGSSLTPGVRRTVMVIEPDEDVRRMVEAMLNTAGYNVVTAKTVDAAVEAGSIATTDMVLCGIEQPNGAGWTALRGVQDALPDRPILVSSSVMSESEAIARGAVGVLGKPFRESQLLAAVAYTLRGSLTTGNDEGSPSE